MTRILAVSFSFLLTFSCFGKSSKIAYSDTLDISQFEIWESISKNDTLLSEYNYLDSLWFVKITYESDSLEIEGFIVEPKNGNNLPTVIFNRGGNRNFGAISIEMLIEWVAPIAKEGYIIIASQYRGSSGSEGTDEFGGQDVNDVLNLIPIIDNLPQADTSRIAMFGWSRGGMMTYTALTKTNRIKAAIIGGAPTDLFNVIETRPKMETVFTELIPNYLSHKNAALINRSAIYFTDKLCKSTSYLILHGKNDSRVDYRQVESFVSKLKSQNIKVESVFYEKDDHIIKQHRAEKDAKILSWLQQNL